MGSMNRTHVDLTDHQAERLEEVARRKGRSLPDVIHEAVDLFLREVAPDPDAAREDSPGEGEGAKPGRPDDR